MAGGGVTVYVEGSTRGLVGVAVTLDSTASQGQLWPGNAQVKDIVHCVGQALKLEFGKSSSTT